LPLDFPCDKNEQKMPTPVENLIGFSTITNGASTPPHKSLQEKCECLNLTKI
jgi:hypothetical protein